MSPAVERPGIVYLAVNSVNGKKYVGKTGREFIVRIREHVYDARNKNKTAFSRAVSKYGIEAFTFTVLETCAIAQIDERERYWIVFHACRKPYGYNLTDGGNGGLGTKRPDTAERNRKQVGADNPQFGKTHTPEENARNSALLSGAGNPRFGKAVPQELRALISARTRAAMVRPEVRARFMATRGKISETTRERMKQSALNRHATERARRSA